MRSFRSLLLLPLLVAPVVAACSDDDDAASTTSTTTPTGAQIVAPIIVDGPEQLEIDTGAVLDVVTDGVVEVTTSDDSVLEVTQPGSDGSAEFNGGAIALGTGDAVLTVIGEDGETIYEVDVTVR